MDMNAGEASLTRIVETTRVQLKRFRDAGVSDEDFVSRLYNEFVNLRREMGQDAGSLHMALSCYHMAVLTDYVKELEDKVAFHKAGIEFLLELDECETI